MRAGVHPPGLLTLRVWHFCLLRELRQPSKPKSRPRASCYIYLAPHTLECYEWLRASGERRSRGGWPLFSSRHLCRPGLGSWPSGTPAAHYSIVPRSCLITSSSGLGSGPTDGIPAMPNGIQELPAGTFALHVAGVFVDGRPAHIHSHPLRCPSSSHNGSTWIRLSAVHTPGKDS